MYELEVAGLEVLWVKVIALRMNLLLGVIYAPGYDDDVFGKLRTSMEHIPPYLRRNIVLVGDFNCSELDWSRDAGGASERERDFPSLQKEFRLWQKMKERTRQRGSSSSSLDLVFSSEFSLVRGVRITKPPAATNDNHGIRFSLEIMTPKTTVKPRKKWIVDDDGARNFRTSLSSVDWGAFSVMHCNADVAVISFQELFLATAKDCFQLRSVGSRRPLRPSLSATTVESQRKSRGAFQKWRREKDSKDYDAGRESEIRSKRLIRADRYRKLRTIASSSKRNQRAVWQYLEKNTVSNPLPPIPIPGSEDRYLVHPQDKAYHISTVLAKEYVDCSAHCSQQYKSLPCRITPPSSVHCPELQISTSSILSIIRKLDARKAAGFSLITNHLLKIAGVSGPRRCSSCRCVISSRRSFWRGKKQTSSFSIVSRPSTDYRMTS
ncbi:hypothetical protein RvY_01021-3 [Ramazzottius varieornatus]|uniref:Endonuclease/exonuclease/phosphatase domain-containing protein n=1 Tax=Ramazzottius varieornatus TaxID=947166 RepID=A0A1D1UIF7_RAMVA|nr:hypothetical protein RvY_01021-3 [Ramazzottius varieornatus]